MLQGLVALVVFGIGSFAFMLSAYRNILDEAGEARVLREVNRVQQQEIERFAGETNHLIGQMEEIGYLAELVADKLGLPIVEARGE